MKAKWETLAGAFIDGPKVFLRKFAALKQVDDFKNLDDDSVETIARFLRGFHNVNQKHMIEVIGGADKFNARCLL